MKKKMISLTNKELESYANNKRQSHLQEKFEYNDNDKEYYKVRDHCHCIHKYRSTAHSICILEHKMP